MLRLLEVLRSQQEKGQQSEENEGSRNTEAVMTQPLSSSAGPVEAASQEPEVVINGSTLYDIVFNGGGISGFQPLLMEHILEIIFNHLFFPYGEPIKGRWESLESTRLVCNQWNEVATRLYRRKRSPISFNISVCKDGDSLDEMRSFVDWMKTSSCQPSEKFSIGVCLKSEDCHSLMEEFFDVCGPIMTRLELRTCRHQEPEAVNNDMADISRFGDIKISAMKSLASLTFRIDSEHGNLYWQTEDGLLGPVLTAAPNLQELYIKSNYNHSNLIQQFENLRALTDHIEGAIASNVPKNLKILKLDIPVRPHLAKALLAKNLRLEHLKLCLYNEFGEDDLLPLLESVKDSLTTLELSIWHRNANRVLTLPPLPQLRRLELKKIQGIPLQSRGAFPKLETLIAMQWSEEAKDRFKKFLEAVSGSIGLKLLCLSPYCANETLVSQVLRNFSNLKVLQFGPSKEFGPALSCIFGSLPKIETLGLLCPRVDHRDEMLCFNSLFSGIHREICGDLYSRNGAYDGVDPSIYETRASLKSLEKLKKLVVVANFGPAHDIHTRNPAVVTNFLAHFVYLQMKSLRELKLVGEFRIILNPKYKTLMEPLIKSDGKQEWRDFSN